MDTLFFRMVLLDFQAVYMLYDSIKYMNEKI